MLLILAGVILIAIALIGFGTIRFVFWVFVLTFAIYLEFGPQEPESSTTVVSAAPSHALHVPGTGVND